MHKKHFVRVRERPHFAEEYLGLGFACTSVGRASRLHVIPSLLSHFLSSVSKISCQIKPWNAPPKKQQIKPGPVTTDMAVKSPTGSLEISSGRLDSSSGRLLGSHFISLPPPSPHTSRWEHSMYMYTLRKWWYCVRRMKSTNKTWPWFVRRYKVNILFWQTGCNRQN